MHMAQMASVVRRSTQVVFQNLTGDEGAVLLNLESGLYFGVDPVGAMIWELLETPRTEQELRDQLVEEFAVDPERALADVRGFVAGLEQRSLVVRGEPG
jgi:hypothetical protein